MPSTHLSLHYHIVFSTKERRPLITKNVRERLHSFLCAVIERLGGVPEGIGGVADHVHILLGLRATHRLSDFVRMLKSESSKWVHENLGIEDFLWQEGYGAFTVSASQRERVKEYIRNQESHHGSRNFENEYVELLEKSGVDFDERYLW